MSALCFLDVRVVEVGRMHEAFFMQPKDLVQWSVCVTAVQLQTRKQQSKVQYIHQRIQNTAIKHCVASACRVVCVCV